MAAGLSLTDERKREQSGVLGGQWKQAVCASVTLSHTVYRHDSNRSHV